MDTARKIWRERVLYFSLGILSVAVVFFILGASSDYQNNTLNFGRYAISSWATQIDQKSGVVGAFVMDTVSGETRTVYIRTYGAIPESKADKNNLKKPFISME